MNKRKIFFIVWVFATAGIFYFWKTKSSIAENPSVRIEQEQEQNQQESSVPISGPEATSINDELPAKLKGRIDSVLERIEGMWDPSGEKVKEVGAKMEDLEKALEENQAELAEKILSEIEVIVSEK